MDVLEFLHWPNLAAHTEHFVVKRRWEASASQGCLVCYCLANGLWELGHYRSTLLEKGLDEQAGCQRITLEGQALEGLLLAQS